MKRTNHHIDYATWSVGETQIFERPALMAHFAQKDYKHFWGAKGHLTYLERIGLILQKDDKHNEGKAKEDIDYIDFKPNELAIKIAGERNIKKFKNWLQENNPLLLKAINTTEKKFKTRPPASPSKQDESGEWKQTVFPRIMSLKEMYEREPKESGSGKHSKSHVRQHVKRAPRHPKGHRELF